MRFPWFFQRFDVLGELVLIQRGVVRFEMLDQGARGDIRVAVERVLKGTDVGVIDGSEELALERVFDFVVHGESLDGTVIVAHDDSSLGRGRAVRNVWLRARVDRDDPIGPCDSGECVVGDIADDEDGESMLASTQNRVDRRRVGEEFTFELADGEVGWHADDGREFRMRKVEG